MRVLVTGAKGFIGKNLIQALRRIDDISIIEFDKDDSLGCLDEALNNIDFIFHLAGVNRPENTEEFYEGNSDLTSQLLDIIREKNIKIPVLMTSSTQIERDNDYGRSKLKAENFLKEYSVEQSVPVYIYRLPNVFGKWSRPNYNTVIATWCHNLSSGNDIRIDNRETELTLVYIDDVVKEFISILHNDRIDLSTYYYDIPVVYRKTLGEISDLLYSFRANRNNLTIPPVGNGFERALYATYLSFLERDNFSYPLTEHSDDRGSFVEILKTINSGQFSISTSAPGITRGNHYHDTKNEKFLVIKGSAVIRFRHIHESEVFEYNVSDQELQVIDIPPGYTHNITNTGEGEMFLVIWANEIFDRDNPDTFFQEV